jgi:hypothetical protein
MLLAWVMYAANRFLLKPLAPPSWVWVHSWFQDFLLVPALLPPVLWLFATLKLRESQLFPTWTEILFHTIWWSLFFEFIGPQLLHRGTGDYRDIIAYGLGAIGAGIFWKVGQLPSQK